MPWKTILTALETGKMKGIGDSLTAPERDTIAKYLGTAEAQPIPASAHCSTPAPPKAGASWNGWSDAANTRFQPAKAAGLNQETTPKLRLKWAFGFPGVTSAF